MKKLKKLNYATDGCTLETFGCYCSCSCWWFGTVNSSNDTIEDNITVYKRYNLPMELLNLNLFSFINKYHSGIDTKIESKSSGVSGGEKQKIALLRALNKSGRILVLDEPTSNYDQESEEEFIKLISELNNIDIIARYELKNVEKRIGIQIGEYNSYMVPPIVSIILRIKASEDYVSSKNIREYLKKYSFKL